MSFGEIVMSAMGGILPLYYFLKLLARMYISHSGILLYLPDDETTSERIYRRLLRCIISPKRNEFLAGSSDVYLYKISKPMNIYLIRHTSVDVPKGLCYGQSDVPLRPYI